MAKFQDSEPARDEKADRSEDVRRPDEQVLLQPVEIGEHGVQGGNVEKDSADELDEGAQPPDLAWLPGEPPESLLWRLSTSECCSPIGVGRLQQLQVARGGKEDGAREKHGIDHRDVLKRLVERVGLEPGEACQGEAGRADHEQYRTVRMHKLPTLTRWHAWLPVASRHQKYTRGRILTFHK